MVVETDGMEETIESIRFMRYKPRDKQLTKGYSEYRRERHEIADEFVAEVLASHAAQIRKYRTELNDLHEWASQEKEDNGSLLSKLVPVRSSATQLKAEVELDLEVLKMRTQDSILQMLSGISSTDAPHVQSERKMPETLAGRALVQAMHTLAEDEETEKIEELLK
uniref:Uncharacterized protein n=1 Tax=Timspurckia oligopyrenoides TaxID=708627 RepID=A0A7S0ZD48_9RHOD|mmetsp:Transcript_13162/g.23666  ORF Transcript_13162/g.23666 Transcript_13162/m.23666 type:complete len:166 (+) Transcript_13162:18-515(+)